MKKIIINYSLGAESGVKEFTKPNLAEQFLKDLNTRKLSIVGETSEHRFKNKVYKFGQMRHRELRKPHNQAEYEAIKEKLAKLQAVKLSVFVQTVSVC